VKAVCRHASRGDQKMQTSTDSPRETVGRKRDSPVIEGCCGELSGDGPHGDDVAKDCVGTLVASNDPLVAVQVMSVEQGTSLRTSVTWTKNLESVIVLTPCAQAGMW
jgi:hypothetical protein